MFLPTESTHHAGTESSHHVLGGRALTEYWTLDSGNAENIGEIQGTSLDTYSTAAGAGGEVIPGEITFINSIDVAADSTSGNFSQGLRLYNQAGATSHGEIGLRTDFASTLATDGSGFGLAFWFNVASYGDPSPVLTMRFYEADHSPGVWLYFRALKISGSPRIQIHMGSSIIADTGSDNAVSPPATGAWHLAVISYPSATGGALFDLSLDGAAISGVGAGNVGFGPAPLARLYAAILNDGGAVTSDVSFDEIALICDDTFSDDDVQFFWNSGAGITAPEVLNFS